MNKKILSANKTSLFCLLLAGRMLAACSLQAQMVIPNPHPITINMMPDVRAGTPNFYISEKTISPEQYCAFLNAVATTGDPHHLYHPEWGDSKNHPDILSIQQLTHPDATFSYQLVNEETNLPSLNKNFSSTYNPQDPLNTGAWNITMTTIPKREILKGVTLADAARFANWMYHNQPIGPEGPATTEEGSYTFSEVNDQGDMYNFEQKFPRDTHNRELKDVLKRVTRTTEATWRLPARFELETAISTYGALDGSSPIWYWTDDIYDDLTNFYNFPLSNGTHIDLEYNYAGYYRIKNTPVDFTDRTKRCMYQNSFLTDTSFRIAFPASAMPSSGFTLSAPSQPQ